IKLCRFVQDMCVLRDHIKTMCEPRRNPNQASILARERYAVPAPETGRTTPQVNEHVQHFSADDSYQLALRLLNLIMQPAQDGALRVGMIVLNELAANAKLLEDLKVITFEKKSPIILEYFRFQYERTIKDLLENFHELKRPVL